MTLSSMTGYANQAGDSQGYRWSWDLKSVNGRNLDLRCRLPNGFEALEAEVRSRAGAVLRRGHVNIVLALDAPAARLKPLINQAVFDELAMIGRTLAEQNRLPLPTAGEILGLRGVVEMTDPVESKSARNSLVKVLLAGFSGALTQLVKAREAEGRQLGRVLARLLKNAGQLCRKARKTALKQPKQRQERLMAQLRDLLAKSTDIAPERVAQEVALLAIRADVTEELDRLGAHFESMAGLLAGGEAVGRRMDFLIQEMSREANTFCAKSSDLVLTQLGLDLKATIDQMREQVQNLE